METPDYSKLQKYPPFKHPDHFSGNLGSNFGRREKPITGNLHLLRENHGRTNYAEESEYRSNYWDRVRKSAVKTEVTVTPLTQKSVRGVSDSSCEENRVMGGTNARQLFDEMRVRNMKENKHDGEMRNSNVGDRNKALNLFRLLCKCLKKEASVAAMAFSKRIDIEAYNVLQKKDNGKLLNFPRLIGPIPGVEIGDEFEFRMELKIIGLHCPSIHGIDSMVGPNGVTMATSIVSTEGYMDKRVNRNTLVYTGEGGGLFEGKGNVKDQELRSGNLAMQNSIKEGNFVRVVRGVKPSCGYVSNNGGTRKTVFVYDGLYKVVDSYREMGLYGNVVFQFVLERCPAQTSIPWEKYK